MIDVGAENMKGQTPPNKFNWIRVTNIWVEIETRFRLCTNLFTQCNTYHELDNISCDFDTRYFHFIVVYMIISTLCPRTLFWTPLCFYAALTLHTYTHSTHISNPPLHWLPSCSHCWHFSPIQLRVIHTLNSDWLTLVTWPQQQPNSLFGFSQPHLNIPNTCL